MNQIVALFIVSLLWGNVALADEAPISGTIKAIDMATQTVTLETTAKGKTREVTVDIKPGSRIVRFTRAADLGKAGFIEQAASLSDLKPAGW